MFDVVRLRRSALLIVFSVLSPGRCVQCSIGTVHNATDVTACYATAGCAVCVPVGYVAGTADLPCYDAQTCVEYGSAIGTAADAIISVGCFLTDGCAPCLFPATPPTACVWCENADTMAGGCMSGIFSSECVGGGISHATIINNFSLCPSPSASPALSDSSKWSPNATSSPTAIASASGSMLSRLGVDIAIATHNYNTSQIVFDSSIGIVFSSAIVAGIAIASILSVFLCATFWCCAAGCFDQWHAHQAVVRLRQARLASTAAAASAYLVGRPHISIPDQTLVDLFCEAMKRDGTADLSQLRLRHVHGATDASMPRAANPRHGSTALLDWVTGQLVLRPAFQDISAATPLQPPDASPTGVAQQPRGSVSSNLRSISGRDVARALRQASVRRVVALVLEDVALVLGEAGIQPPASAAGTEGWRASLRAVAASPLHVGRPGRRRAVGSSTRRAAVALSPRGLLVARAVRCIQEAHARGRGSLHPRSAALELLLADEEVAALQALGARSIAAQRGALEAGTDEEEDSLLEFDRASRGSLQSAGKVHEGHSEHGPAGMVAMPRTAGTAPARRLSIAPIPGSVRNVAIGMQAAKHTAVIASSPAGTPPSHFRFETEPSIAHVEPLPYLPLAALVEDAMQTAAGAVAESVLAAMASGGDAPLRLTVLESVLCSHPSWRGGAQQVTVGAQRASRSGGVGRWAACRVWRGAAACCASIGARALRASAWRLAVLPRGSDADDARIARVLQEADASLCLAAATAGATTGATVAEEGDGSEAAAALARCRCCTHPTAAGFSSGEAAAAAAVAVADPAIVALYGLSAAQAEALRTRCSKELARLRRKPAHSSHAPSSQHAPPRIAREPRHSAAAAAAAGGLARLPSDAAAPLSAPASTQLLREFAVRGNARAAAALSECESRRQRRDLASAHRTAAIQRLVATYKPVAQPAHAASVPQLQSRSPPKPVHRIVIVDTSVSVCGSETGQDHEFFYAQRADDAANEFSKGAATRQGAADASDEARTRRIAAAAMAFHVGPANAHLYAFSDHRARALARHNELLTPSSSSRAIVQRLSVATYAPFPSAPPALGSAHTHRVCRQLGATSAVAFAGTPKQTPYPARPS